MTEILLGKATIVKTAIYAIIVIPAWSFAALKLIDAAEKIWKGGDFRKKWVLLYAVFLILYMGTLFNLWGGSNSKF